MERIQKEMIQKQAEVISLIPSCKKSLKLNEQRMINLQRKGIYSLRDYQHWNKAEIKIGAILFQV
jgi:hypothetical protein